MDGISATVKEHRRPRHHLIFPRNFLIAGDECFMANALVLAGHARTATNTDRGTLESISSDSPYGDN